MKPKHDHESGAFEVNVREILTLEKWKSLLKSITLMIAQSNDDGLIIQIKEGHLLKLR